MPARMKAAGPRLVKQKARLALREDGSLRLAVVSDTHSQPHPSTLAHLTALRPDAIVHAGDIGDLDVLEQLATVAPVLAVRGNIDTRADALPDVLTVDVVGERGLRLLVTHIAVYGPKLRADVARMARAEGAAMVICGHSHVPFIGRDRELIVFNPGSVGPRRFHLPIVFGTLDVTPKGAKPAHFDCETGLPWSPP
jgi:putative phosphoesterase